METSEALTVLWQMTDPDPAAFLAALPWDTREDVVMPDGTTVVFGTVGTVNVWAHTDGLDVMAVQAHDHPDATDADQCHTRNVELAHGNATDSPLAEDIRRLSGPDPLYYV